MKKQLKPVKSCQRQEPEAANSHQKWSKKMVQKQPKVAKDLRFSEISTFIKTQDLAHPVFYGNLLSVEEPRPRQPAHRQQQPAGFSGLALCVKAHGHRRRRWDLLAVRLPGVCSFHEGFVHPQLCFHCQLQEAFCTGANLAF